MCTTSSRCGAQCVQPKLKNLSAFGLGLGRTQMPPQEEGRNSTHTGHRAPLFCQGLPLARKISCIARPIWWLIHVAGVIIDKKKLSCFTSQDFIQRQIQPYPRWLPLHPCECMTQRVCFIFPRHMGLCSSLKHKAGCRDAEPGLAVIRVTQDFSELLQLKIRSFTSHDLLHSCQTERAPRD